MDTSVFVDLLKHQDGKLLLLGISLLAVVYKVTRILYRFYFHPLAKIPGPPLAIATYLYEWYYDIWHHGTYNSRLPQLHEKYGPVLRLNPDEVHVLDHEYYPEVFNNTSGRVDKPEHIAGMIGPYPTTFGTAGYELHRLRRSAVSGFFSRAAVIELAPAIMRPLNILCDRLQNATQTEETLNMRYFFEAVTRDVIADYCFARSPVDVLKNDFNKQGFDEIENFLSVNLLNINFPALLRPLFYLPDWLAKILFPPMMDTLDFRYDLSRQIEAIRNGDNEAYKESAHRTIFHEILSNEKLPPSELAPNRIRDEAWTLMVAGSGTMYHPYDNAQVLRVTSYHISANPDIRQRLFAELKNAIPDSDQIPTLQELEKLEYLSAVAREGLRIADTLIHRLARTFPDKTMVHPSSGLSIPAGTTIYMSPCLMLHHNPLLFPEPYAFQPDRWLGSEGKKLEKYLSPFARGTRDCLGLNLARAELVIILATIYRRFDFDVSAVVRRRDIDMTRDFIVGAPAKDSPGILVKVKAAN
ncbi:MAG: hypothetical protein GOMPHAMPRED_005365 [Gomphillus americanus]|uniref:Cytochrome P450 n=1 Tax=Gomphillus americanus TaxID=1940652 RepID=A0A8H3FNI4_9LECA|nr:MAG: hypothetical protein GOMPHAMPRED_005365 [Gomphillus americanus]